MAVAVTVNADVEAGQPFVLALPRLLETREMRWDDMASSLWCIASAYLHRGQSQI